MVLSNSDAVSFRKIHVVSGWETSEIAKLVLQVDKE